MISICFLNLDVSYVSCQRQSPWYPYSGTFGPPTCLSAMVCSAKVSTKIELGLNKKAMPIRHDLSWPKLNVAPIPAVFGESKGVRQQLCRVVFFLTGTYRILHVLNPRKVFSPQEPLSFEQLLKTPQTPSANGQPSIFWDWMGLYHMLYNFNLSYHYMVLWPSQQNIQYLQLRTVQDNMTPSRKQYFDGQCKFETNLEQ